MNDYVGLTFWSDNQIKNPINLEDYSAILVDEVHLPEVQIFRLTNRIRTNAEYLAVVLNDRYYYDEEGYLRSSNTGKKSKCLMFENVFHDLNQAKESLALIILGNKEVYGRLLNLLQG